jgi:mRNA interferase MazF
MPYCQRDLLLVPVPFSDLTSTKIRPVVVLSNDRYNQECSDILVTAITSNVSARKYAVPIDTAQLDEGEMRRASVIRADKIFSIDQAIVLRSFGRVNEDVFHKVQQAITILINPQG